MPALSILTMPSSMALMVSSLTSHYALQTLTRVRQTVNLL